VPRLLDLFCGAGGAGMGYHRAGFDVVGVDIEPQPRYPFEFVQMDALQALEHTNCLSGFDAIHASPPCQDYSRSMRHLTGGYPRLIEPVRQRLIATGLPWVIENVPGAPLPVQTDLFGAHGLELCGSMFGLRIFRHRLFETSFPITAPRGCDHSLLPMNPHFNVNRRQWRELLGPDVPLERRWREEMGVGWMNDDEGREAIPPAYTDHIGRQLLAQLAERAV
jgi:DNA (cytosine-5)-methyltransferase 1